LLLSTELLPGAGTTLEDDAGGYWVEFEDDADIETDA
jgi:hypothetical protein